MGTSQAERDALIALFREGVAALAEQAEATEGDAAACGTWTADEVVRHVASVAHWYHEWLDRAEAGEATRPFPSAELPWRNDEAIHARVDEAPAHTLADFVETAQRYADRLPDQWATPYGYPFGTVTAGLHAAAATSEWHLHARDLARARGADHRPSDPATLFRAVGRCVAVSRDDLIGKVQGTLVRAGSFVAPWPQLVRASGRRVRR